MEVWIKPKLAVHYAVMNFCSIEAQLASSTNFGQSIFWQILAKTIETQWKQAAVITLNWQSLDSDLTT